MPGEKPTSRRDFLRGKAAAQAVLEKMQALADRATSAFSPNVGEAASATGPPSKRSAGLKLHASRRAMACEFAVQYHAADGPAATDAMLAAFDMIDQLETQLTIYRDQSDIISINRTAAQQPVAVEPQLFALLELCAWLYEETGWAFDLTSSALSRVWGFLRREGRVPTEAEVAAALAAVGQDKVVLNASQQTVRFLDPAVEINVNAVGKGYALDRAAQLLAERGVNDYLWHGGNSSVLARGRDREDDGWGWRIAVPHPHGPGEIVGVITLVNQALGTSGAGTQFFVADGRRYGHLIDPRTGWPAEDVYTATVVAATAAEADALSTAFYVMGPGETAEYCAAHEDVAAVLVCPRDGGNSDFDVHAFNLDPRRWRPT
jgi:thiamine biosynthesis lipoprotein